VMSTARNFTVDKGVAPFVPYHSEDEPSVLCWDCHGWLIGPHERRFCHCKEPGAVSPADAERFRSLEALRDALAEAYRMRLFKVLLPLLDGVTKGEARAAWDSLWTAARLRAARRLAERGLR
jgi:hypothetical protein